MTQIKSVDGTFPNDMGCAEGKKKNLSIYIYIMYFEIMTSLVILKANFGLKLHCYKLV